MRKISSLPSFFIFGIKYATCRLLFFFLIFFLQWDKQSRQSKNIFEGKKNASKKQKNTNAMEEQKFLTHDETKLHFPGSSGLTPPTSPTRFFFSYQPTAALHHII